MARPTVALIQALRTTALRLEGSEVAYRWSSYGQCNCGHLAQTVTGLSDREIQERAFEREGDWGERAASHPAPRWAPWLDYGDRPALDEGAWQPEDVGACRATGTPLDAILARLYALGLTEEDIRHLERLSDPAVRARLDGGAEYFAHHDRDNAVKYMLAWADLLEEQLGEDAFVLAAE